MPQSTPDLQPPQRDVYSVSRLNTEVRMVLESGFPLLWIEGEISNLARPSSGHLYFSLKDPTAQVRCAMFRNRNQLLNFRPRDGMQVLARARVSLYEGRGEFQLVIEHLEEFGHGALQRAFEALKQKLAGEGLFDAAHKRPLPRFPRRVGVITSPTGAAIRDVLAVLRRRFPALPVLVYPVPVQGEGAARKIAEAIALADARRDCDVLILTRGGGSLEDLWAFNEEEVARAVHACGLPIVCGVGHEIDFSIADFAADVRAPTPSAAAELVSPNGPELLGWLARTESRLGERMQQRLREGAVKLQGLSRRLQARHPVQRLRQHAQRLDELEQRLGRAAGRAIGAKRERVTRGRIHLARFSPANRVARLTDRLTAFDRRLQRAMTEGLLRARARVALSAAQLDALSPLATLGRGYAIVRRESDGRVLRSSAEVAVGERVSAQLAHGRLGLRVEDNEPQS